ncbi:VOC family protein, partial [Candidatus Gottesmanbacteria bacterium]|nr:VOC family protein [Candidatus Gottesmanbacteria bacterium]
LEGDLKIDFENTTAVTNELPDLKKKIKLLVRIEVDNADKAYKEIKKDRKLLSKPVTRPWGMRNFYLLDPDDNLIEVYQKL